MNLLLLLLRISVGVLGDAAVEVEWLLQSGAVEVSISNGVADWRGYEGVSFDMENVSGAALPIQLVVESRDAAGRTANSRRTITLAAGERRRLPFFFTNGNAGPYWGMRGIPVYYRLAHAVFANPTANIHLERVTRAALEPDTKENARGSSALRAFKFSGIRKTANNYDITLLGRRI